MKATKPVLAIDPGTFKSAIVLWNGEEVAENDTPSNEELLMETLPNLRSWYPDITTLAIELVQSFGLPVGREVFETVHWSGRFHQQWENMGGEVLLVPRKEVVLHWNGSAKGNDASVWRAVRDEYGEPGTPKAPGLLFCMRGDAHKHERQALALAIYVHRKEQEDKQT